MICKSSSYKNKSLLQQELRSMILQERNSELSNTNNFSAQRNKTDILLRTYSRNFLFSRLLLAKERITLIIVTS